MLEAWRRGAFEPLVSPTIIAEYWRVARQLAAHEAEVDVDRAIGLLIENATVVESPEPAEPICDDRDDDKFLLCARAGAAVCVVSGDKALRRTSGWSEIRVLTPREFVDQFLT
jgi:predicted nucleic acid-binding protein